MFQSMIDKLKPYLTRKSLALFGVLAIMVVLPLAVHAEMGGIAPPKESIVGSPERAAAVAAAASKEGCSSIVDCITYGVEEGVIMIAKLIMKLMGFILILLVRALIWAAQYSNYVSPGPTAVRIGWIVTRDLANMFFIVVLLISAFSTIIGYKDYHYQTVLPRLLITAVLINFSKTLVGILIDFSQVIMLTFVNGFAQAAGGNFMNAFQINTLMVLIERRQIDLLGLILGLLLALVMVTVATAVVLVLTVYLVARIVKIWILIIMAPIAFISKVIPGISGDYAKWWGELTKLLIAGPKIAFFLWLALITAQNSGGKVAKGDGFVPPGYETGATSGEAKAGEDAYGIPTEAAQSDTILSMIIMITLLLAGLQQAQEGGVPGAGFAKKVQGGLKSMGNFARRETLDRLGSTALSGRFSPARLLAKSPIGGGLGRAAILKGESIKASRTASIEKFSGKPEDVARLSPEAFKRAAKGATGKDADKYADTVLKDKKMQANLRAEARDETERVKKVVEAQEKKLGRPLTDGERNAIKPKETTLDIMAKNLADARTKDPNNGGKLIDLQSKFWQQLTEAGTDARKRALSKVAVADMIKPDVIAAGADLSDRKAKELVESENPDHRNAMLELMQSMQKSGGLEKQLETWKLDEAKIPSEFFDKTKAGEETAKTVAGYALDQASDDNHAMNKLMADTSVAAQIMATAAERLAQAQKAPTTAPNRDANITKALVDAINTGAITDATIKGSENIVRALQSSQLKLGNLAKHSEGYSPAQTSAAKTAIAIHLASNPPSRENNARNNRVLNDIMPDESQVAALRPPTAPTAPAPARSAPPSGRSASAPPRPIPPRAGPESTGAREIDFDNPAPPPPPGGTAA